MKHLEIITVERDGVRIAVRMDYDKGTVSLVEKKFDNEWKPKEYLFAGRTLDHMEGWMQILDVMKEAVAKGKDMLENEICDRTSFEIHKMAVEDNIPTQKVCKKK